jgi:hypothetical protein
MEHSLIYKVSMVGIIWARDADRERRQVTLSVMVREFQRSQEFWAIDVGVMPNDLAY